MTKAADRGAGKINKAIEALLGRFDQHREELLTELKDSKRGPRPKPFEEKEAWRSLRFIALTEFWRTAQTEQNKPEIDAADRAKLLKDLGEALRNAKYKAREAIQLTRGPWFLEWCVANGDPDFTDPIITVAAAAFEKQIAGLDSLESAAFRAADLVRRGPGFPGGTAALPHDLIIALEGVYRDITKLEAGAGSGKFARFVRVFLKALGRELAEGSIKKLLQSAKGTDEKSTSGGRWGRSLFDGMGGKNPPDRQ
jgi:hypothetical protein